MATPEQVKVAEARAKEVGWIMGALLFLPEPLFKRVLLAAQQAIAEHQRNATDAGPPDPSSGN